MLNSLIDKWQFYLLMLLVPTLFTKLSCILSASKRTLFPTSRGQKWGLTIEIFASIYYTETKNTRGTK